MKKYRYYDQWNRKWSRGMLLDTPTTRRWDDREKADVDAIERRTIFRKFSTRDDGKSRVFIKRCDTINQAIDECRRHNEIRCIG